jgi:5-methylcytosine-specific restriction endonuclease McrA
MNPYIYKTPCPLCAKNMMRFAWTKMCYECRIETGKQRKQKSFEENKERARIKREQKPNRKNGYSGLSFDVLNKDQKRARILFEQNYTCLCGQPNVWNGKPLTLQIDHNNGLRNDNTRENLRALCPNCHSQTPTFCGKNTQHQRNNIGAG